MAARLDLSLAWYKATVFGSSGYPCMKQLRGRSRTGMVAVDVYVSSDCLLVLFHPVVHTSMGGMRKLNGLPCGRTNPRSVKGPSEEFFWPRRLSLILRGFISRLNQSRSFLILVLKVL